MSPPGESPLWRVGYRGDPLAFAPRDLYEFNHRFDDAEARFRTIYLAELPETALREVLADFRLNLAARHRHVERYGPDAVADFVDEPVTATWRAQHVLAPVRLELHGDLVNLADPGTRQAVEQHYAGLLADHDLEHLDLHEITIGRRIITQTIAGDLYDQGFAAVRFPSRLDGNRCVALFESRGQLMLAGEVVALTDPAPEPPRQVATEWDLALEPAEP